MTERLLHPPGAENGDYSDTEDETEQLRRERDFWKQLFDQLIEEFPEPALVVNSEGIITHWNDPHVELSGTTHKEAIGNQAIDVLGTKGAEETLAEEIARTGETVREDQVRSGATEEGEWHIRAAGSPLRATDGEVVGAFEYVAIVTELIEERRELEEVQESISETVYDGVEELFEATKTTAETNTELEDLTSKQVQNLESIHDEMGSLSASVEEVAASAEEVSGQSAAAADLADDSEEATETIVELVEDIRDAAEELAANSQLLDARIEEIDTIVEVIDEIADGTNLLALNANIQAAQFGSDAAGFGVVADEIKELADKSKQEVETIEDIVDEVRTDTDTTLESVQTTIDHVESAINHARTVNEKQSAIKSAVDEASQGISQIAEATDDQAATTEEVVTMLDSAVQQTKDVSEEVDTLVTVNEEQASHIRSVRDDVQELESNL